MVGIWLKWIYQCTIAQQILVNKVKLCTLKVPHDMQLAMAKFCWSVKDCQSQASFNDFTIKGLGPKILTYRVFFSREYWGIPYHDFVSLQQGLVSPHKKIASPSRLCPLHEGLVPLQKFPENTRENNSLLF